MIEKATDQQKKKMKPQENHTSSGSQSTASCFVIDSAEAELCYLKEMAITNGFGSIIEAIVAANQTKKRK